MNGVVQARLMQVSILARKIFSSQVPLICWFAVCFRENETGIIKRSLPEKRKKNRVWVSDPGSCVLISTASLHSFLEIIVRISHLP